MQEPATIPKETWHFIWRADQYGRTLTIMDGPDVKHRFTDTGGTWLAVDNPDDPAAVAELAPWVTTMLEMNFTLAAKLTDLFDGVKRHG